MDEPKPGDVMWNISRVRVGGDIAGVIGVIGAVVVVITGIPPLKWFFAAALACGAVCAFALSIWHRRHPSPRTPPNTIQDRRT
jgi:hypothetical protein